MNIMEFNEELNSKVLGMFKDEAGGKQIVELLVRELNFTLTKCLMALKIKNVRGCQRMLQNGVLNSMTIEGACLAGRNNIEK